MISWTEQEPDFELQPVEALFARLGFVSAVAVWSRIGTGLQIVIQESVRSSIEAHLLAQHIEQGGLLIGSAFGSANDDQLVVTIEDSVVADDATGTGVSLVMGSAVWENARGRCTGKRTVVGWYHSHPNLGAFFSGTDRATQRGFFSNAHSVGLVSDPIRREEKWFSGPESMEVPATSRILIVEPTYPG